jgi:hypothetical protein
VATSFITSAARTPAGELRPNWTLSGSVEFFEMIEPPADSMRALNQTVRDSERLPCALRILLCSLAAVTSWSQVTGCDMSRPAACATDLRYHSSWVLAQNGIVTSLPSQVAPWMALFTTPSLTRPATSSGTGARKPAWANSGM